MNNTWRGAGMGRMGGAAGLGRRAFGGGGNPYAGFGRGTSMQPRQPMGGPTLQTQGPNAMPTQKPMTGGADPMPQGAMPMGGQVPQGGGQGPMPPGGVVGPGGVAGPGGEAIQKAQAPLLHTQGPGTMPGKQQTGGVDMMPQGAMPPGGQVGGAAVMPQGVMGPGAEMQQQQVNPALLQALAGGMPQDAGLLAPNSAWTQQQMKRPYR